MRVPNDPECQTSCRQNDKLRRTPVEESSLERYRRSATEKIREVVTLGPFEIRANQRSKRETSSYAGWVMAGMSPLVHLKSEQISDQSERLQVMQVGLWLVCRSLVWLDTLDFNNDTKLLEKAKLNL